VRRLLKEILMVIVPIYMLGLMIAFVVGIQHAELKYLGNCNKSSTYIGYYTGLAPLYDFGCKLGRRME
jgi:hypothetical protein